MEKRNKVITTFIFAILLISLLYLFSDWISKTTGYLVEDNPDKDLAKCLSSKGAKLYGSKTCPDCIKQKKLFGDEAFSFINYIECSKNPLACSDIGSVPAWDINGELVYGIKNLDELRILAKC